MTTDLPDDAEPITEDWVRGLGFQEIGRGTYQSPCGVRIWQSSTGDCWCWDHWDNVDMHTRRKLRDLLRWLEYTGPLEVSDPCL